MVLYAHNNVNMYFFLYIMKNDKIIEWTLSYIVLVTVVTTVSG